jgi:transcriptional regulator with PAS, ATPase and Fis domain
VHTHDGRALHVHARFNWPVWSQITEAAAVHAPKLDEDRPGPTPAPGAEHRAAVPEPGAAASSAPGSAMRTDGPTLAQLQTGDAQMDALVGKLKRVIDRDIPILLLGETGTGKELLARAIHAESTRARQAFVAVNCASIPDTLIEAELFGYEEGAFNGARSKGALGKILQATGGTLFLDEIGDMPLPLQAHLLRVLQDRQVTPLGSTRAVKVDLAIICATHRNLRDMIEAKAFRQDLYYRLNGLATRVPPLRERTDLAALVRRILDGAAAAPHLGLSGEVQSLIQGYDWPGNVRQLFNVLRTAAVMAGSERWIRLEHLPEDFVDELRQRRQAEPPTRAAPDGLRPLHEVEREVIERAVAEAGGNISVAARRLGVSRNTIYRRLRWNDRSSD